MLQYGNIETVMGNVFVAYRHEGISVLAALAEGDFIRRCIRLRGIEPCRERHLPPEIETIVHDSLARDKVVLPASLNFQGMTAFQQAALCKLAEIPRGEVRTYGWIATHIGHQGASRAVGTAMALNPFPLLLPCHRVVKADWTVGAYSGGPPGFKTRLLAAEGVHLASPTPSGALHTFGRKNKLHG